jgi:hypothetical protein
MLRFAEETAGVSIITDPSVADEAALLQADPTQRNDTRYPGAVGDHLQDLDTAYIEAPSYEQALGLAEHTMSVWPDGAVAVLDEADLRPMEEFDVMIAVDESLLSIQPAEETAAEVEELEREASIEAVEARFEAIQQDVRQLMLSEQVPDEEVRDRVRAMAEPVTVGESVTSTSHTGQESLLPGIPGVTPVRAALAALSTVLVFGLGVLVLALVGGENLPDISAVVPDVSMATLVPGNVSPLTVAIGGAIIGVLLIALSTVISSRS